MRVGGIEPPMNDNIKSTIDVIVTNDFPSRIKCLMIVLYTAKVYPQ